MQTNSHREIVDESDVFVDVHKAIRRMHPVSYYKIPKASIDEGILGVDGAGPTRTTLPRKLSTLSDSQIKGPKARLNRRRSSGGMESIEIRNQDPQLRQHLSHLGPSNLASAPKSTRINTVKIKPARVTLNSPSPPHPHSRTPDPIFSPRSLGTSPAAPLLKENRQSPSAESSLLSAGYQASDAARAVHYGTLSTSPKGKPKAPVEQIHKVPTQPSPLHLSEGVYGDGDASPTSRDPAHPSILVDTTETASHASMIALAGSVGSSYPAKLVVTPARSVEQLSNENVSIAEDNESSHSGPATGIAPSPEEPSADTPSRLAIARSGSIYQRGLEVDGVPKVVLDVHEDDHHGVRLEVTATATRIGEAEGTAPGPSEIGEERAPSPRDAEADAEPRKKRRRRYKKKKPKGGPSEDPGSADGGVAL
jgi:metal transporter CNNM